MRQDSVKTAGADFFYQSVYGITNRCLLRLLGNK